MTNKSLLFIPLPDPLSVFDIPAQVSKDPDQPPIDYSLLDDLGLLTLTIGVLGLLALNSHLPSLPPSLTPAFTPDDSVRKIRYDFDANFLK